MAICLATDVVDKFAEVEGRVKIEQNPKEEHAEGRIGEVKHIEEVTTCEHPLHHKGIENESIKDAHAEAALGYGCGHAKSKQPQDESVGGKDIEIEEHDSICPDLELEYVSKEAETNRDDDHMNVVCQ